jgi:hypothetical protein
VIPKKKIPEESTFVKCKWVFKVKKNRIYRVRLVVCGYSQLPSIDFTKSYAPVINDVLFRIILIRMMVWNLKAKIIEIESTLLHGGLKESIFMNKPSDKNIVDRKCLVLKKIIYGLVQSATQFYVKLVKALKNFGFKGILENPCLWVKQSNDDGKLREQIPNYRVI